MREMPLELNLISCSRCFLVALLSACACFNASASDPAVVPSVRKEVQSIDKQVPHWKTVSQDESCEGDGCSDSTVYLDSEGRIRKLVTEIDGTGAVNSKDRCHTELTYYFGDQEQALFCFTRSQCNLESATPHQQDDEGRYYFQDGKLMAWKKNDAWIVSNDPKWL